ncbi:MAG: GxxExxY protein [Bacteroidetes bacterium]|nr:GxxExxY protein [Bacteroidota bacterium]
MLLTKSSLKDLTYQINGAAIEVHKALGPGLLEHVYHQCLKHELQLRDIDFVSEMVVAVEYKDLEIETSLRCDFYVEDSIVIELKSVESTLPIHEAQLMTYMKLLNAPKGILFNFNCINLYREGQKTYVNDFFRRLPE